MHALLHRASTPKRCALLERASRAASEPVCAEATVRSVEQQNHRALARRGDPPSQHGAVFGIEGAGEASRGGEVRKVDGEAARPDGARAIKLVGETLIEIADVGETSRRSAIRLERTFDGPVDGLAKLAAFHYGAHQSVRRPDRPLTRASAGGNPLETRRVANFDGQKARGVIAPCKPVRSSALTNRMSPRTVPDPVGPKGSPGVTRPTLENAVMRPRCQRRRAMAHFSTNSR